MADSPILETAQNAYVLVPPGCGETLQASSNWVTLTDMLDRQLSDGDYTECNYWIESPKGTVIELQIVDYPWGYVSAGCSLAGFEIKSNKNQTATGYRDAVSCKDNVLPLMPHDRILQSSFEDAELRRPVVFVDVPESRSDRRFDRIAPDHHCVYQLLD
ncbi:hypothetical protein TELCIR_05966 [Teladorsagia circumcincta]|uniref:CUB domain-containing protein n=1 Tax=Teladorsagia circumcincta TaxID=45464 RepID=A0A2G9UP97_TELCI|nr:hypothetical protein TELCIR_05966 [Teladorsagia circumcincta]